MAAMGILLPLFLLSLELLLQRRPAQHHALTRPLEGVPGGRECWLAVCFCHK